MPRKNTNTRITPTIDRIDGDKLRNAITSIWLEAHPAVAWLSIWQTATRGTAQDLADAVAWTRHLCWMGVFDEEVRHVIILRLPARAAGLDWDLANDIVTSTPRRNIPGDLIGRALQTDRHPSVDAGILAIAHCIAAAQHQTSVEDAADACYRMLYDGLGESLDFYQILAEHFLSFGDAVDFSWALTDLDNIINFSDRDLPPVNLAVLHERADTIASWSRLDAVTQATPTAA